MIKNIFFVMLIASNLLFSSSPNNKTAYSSDDEKAEAELREFLSKWAVTRPSSPSTPLPQPIPLTAANTQAASLAIGQPVIEDDFFSGNWAYVHAAVEKEVAEMEQGSSNKPIKTQQYIPSRTPSPVALRARVITIHHRDASGAGASNQPSPSSTSTNATGILDMIRKLNQGS